MLKKGLIAILILALIIGLYLIEMSKIDSGGDDSMPTLDNLRVNEAGKNWDSFYKVNAKIIDGQSAIFSIPEEITNKEGEIIQLSGAMVFSGNGCEIADTNRTRVDYFFLVPSLGLANACVLQPDDAMRWTIRVNLAHPWILSRNNMINAQASVSGVLRIDTSKPYEAAFILEDANAKLISEDD